MRGAAACSAGGGRRPSAARAKLPCVGSTWLRRWAQAWETASWKLGRLGLSRRRSLSAGGTAAVDEDEADAPSMGGGMWSRILAGRPPKMRRDRGRRLVVIVGLLGPSSAPVVSPPQRRLGRHVLRHNPNFIAPQVPMLGARSALGFARWWDRERCWWICSIDSPLLQSNASAPLRGSRPHAKSLCPSSYSADNAACNDGRQCAVMVKQHRHKKGSRRNIIYRFCACLYCVQLSCTRGAQQDVVSYFSRGCRGPGRRYADSGGRLRASR